MKIYLDNNQINPYMINNENHPIFVHFILSVNNTNAENICSDIYVVWNSVNNFILY